MDMEIKDEKELDRILAAQSDKKVSFGKLIFSGKRGPYIVAFPDSLVRNYAESNALEFKNVNINDIKTDTVPIWECGARNPEQINALPKLNIAKHKEKAVKEKEKRKAAKSAKMKETLAKKARKN